MYYSGSFHELGRNFSFLCRPPVLYVDIRKLPKFLTAFDSVSSSLWILPVFFIFYWTDWPIVFWALSYISLLRKLICITVLGFSVVYFRLSIHLLRVGCPNWNCTQHLTGEIMENCSLYVSFTADQSGIAVWGMNRLRPWVRNPLKAWMSVYVYSVFVLFCV
jgi:hypothetical protein